MTDSEFPRPIRLDTLGGGIRRIEIAAEAPERIALARRFGLVAIETLTAEAAMTRDGEVVTAEGRLEAQVVQSCVATGEPLPARIGSPFTLRFVPDATIAASEEIELSEEDCDVIGYAGSAIDLGEAIAETLALALDPFPRSPDAAAALRAAGVLDESEAGPFAALKALKDKM